MRHVIACLAVLGCLACADSSLDTDSPVSNKSSSKGGTKARDDGDKASTAARDGSGSGASGDGARARPETDPRAGGPNAGLAMDECGLRTQFAGDEYCINPPPPDQGFQIHIGPSDYENPEPEYVLQPGDENVVTMNTVSGNEMPVTYYYRQYRMRPGSHHVILSGGGRRLGGTQNLAKDNPDRGIIPPENEDVGLPLGAKANVSVNMHYYNATSKPIIREIWVNFWYKDPATVKQRAVEVFSGTGVSAAVAHSHVVVGATCDVREAGRVLTLYGHRHYNNVRFSVWRQRGDTRDLVLEDYDAEHPSVFEFNSITTNPVANPETKTAGAWSGVLDLMPGDKMSFECEIINNTDKNFVGQNEAQDDEMCIMVGDAVGMGIPFRCPANQARTISSP